MGKIVTVPEKRLFLLFEMMTTGLVFEISFPKTGSRTARYISPLLIFIPSLQINGFKLFCKRLALLFSCFITFFKDFLQFLVLNLCNPPLKSFSHKLAFFFFFFLFFF